MVSIETACVRRQAWFSVASSSSPSCEASRASVDNASCTAAQRDRRVVLDTGPFAAPTHWQQAVLPLPLSVLARTEDVVVGDFRLRPADGDARGVAVRLQYALCGRHCVENRTRCEEAAWRGAEEESECTNAQDRQAQVYQMG